MNKHNESNSKELNLMVAGNQGVITPQQVTPSYAYDLADEKPAASLLDYWTAWKKSLKYILLFVLTFAALMLLLALLSNKTYTSKASIKIETDHTRILEYDVDTSRPPSYINDDVFYNTQYKLLRNHDLARQVITDLDMSDSLLAEKKFIPPVYTITNWLKAQVEYLRTFLPTQSEGKKERVTPEEIFFQNLTISPVRRSRIIDLHYTAQNPEEAQIVLQTYIQTFIESQQLRRMESTEEAKQYLSTQIETSREKMQNAEKQLLDYARDNKIVDTQADVSVIGNNISLLNEAYIKAKSRRIDAESQFQNKQNISTLLNASADPVVQAKKQELSSLQAEYSSKLSLFKPAYPEMKRLKQQIDRLQAYISNESRTVEKNTSQNMRANYIATLEEEKKLNREIKKLEKDLLKYYENSIGYTSLKRDVDTSRNLYEGLLQRLKEISVIGPVPGDNISVVDNPELPARKDGLSYSKYLLLGSFLGFIIYSFITFLREMFSPKVRNEQGLASLSTKYAVLTSIPQVKKRWFGLGSLATKDAFDPGAAEALRYLRTALQLGQDATGIPQSIHITSPNPGDGKSTVAVFLASSLANTGKKVLLIDCDLRKPSIHKKLNLDNKLGLSNYLYDSEIKAHKSYLPNSPLFFMTITAGPAVNDPVDTLDSASFSKLIANSRKVFDHIIIDSPPVLGMADALVIAGQVDSTLLVVANNNTRKTDAQTAINRLESSTGKIAGLVCNRADQSFSKNYYNTRYTDGRAMIALRP
ncbi:MAG: GumC family protein [Thiolinea sp.]